jgi:hypothetical protein
MDELETRLERVKKERADLIAARDETREQFRSAFDRTIGLLGEDIAELEQQIIERDRQRASDAVRQSPMGQLVYAVAEAIGFDYYDGQDASWVVAEIERMMSQRGFKVEVVPLDE